MCLAVIASFTCGHVFSRGRDSCIPHLHAVQRGLVAAEDPCRLGSGQIHCYVRPDRCYTCLNGFTKAKFLAGVPEPARWDRAVYVPDLDDEKWIENFRGIKLDDDNGKRKEEVPPGPPSPVAPTPYGRNYRSAYRKGAATRTSFRDRMRR